MELVFGEHILDVARRELRRRGELVALQPQVCDILIYLIQNRDRMVSKDELLDAIWGGRIVSESALTTRINAVRKAVGDTGAAQHVIRTIQRKGVRFVGEVHPSDIPATRGDAALWPAPPDRPSIAVLPFANLTGDPEQENFSDGLVEEIAAALSHIRWIIVIARNSGAAIKGRVVEIGNRLAARYLLEGSVRRAEGRVRIAVQLVEAAGGAHLWADHFDGSLADIFELQDRVAASVAGAAEPALQAAEIRRSADRPEQELTVYDLYLRARADMQSWDRPRVHSAFDLLRRVVEIDPSHGPALALLAMCHANFYVNGWTDTPEAARRAGIELARQAVHAAEDDPYVLANAAYVLGQFGEDIAAARSLADRALELNPSFARGWLRRGWLDLWAGQPDSAIEQFETFCRLSPRESRAAAFFGIGVGQFFRERFAEAQAMLLLSLQEIPGWAPTYRFLASCYALTGQLDRARVAVEELRAITSELVPDASHWCDPAHRELFLSGLRAAIGEPR